jgi:hypothetical protein
VDPINMPFDELYPLMEPVLRDIHRYYPGEAWGHAAESYVMMKWL